MAKIFLVISLVVMLATAALGFMAKGNIDKLKSILNQTKDSLQRTEKTLATTKATLKTTEENLTAANTKIEENTKEIAAKQGQIDDLTKKFGEATAMVEAKTKEVADLTADRDAIKIAMEKAGGEPGVDLGVKLAEMQTNLSKAQQELAEAKQVQDQLGRQVREKEERLAAAELKEKQRQQGFVRAGLSGRILAVNPGWNFVVLSIGDKQGAVVNSPMLVMRGSEPIARVRISSVEPSTSIADVIPGSLRRGVTVQPGDTVVYEGKTPVPSPDAGGVPR